MSLKATRIFPAAEQFPWDRIRDFTGRNEDFLTVDTYTQFSFDILDEGNNPSDYHVDLGFCPSNRGIVDIYGQIEANDGTFSTLVLDLEKDAGEVDISSYGMRVGFHGDEFYVFMPDGLHPEFDKLAEDYMLAFWRVIETVIDENGMVQEEINNRMERRQAVPDFSPPVLPINRNPLWN